MATPSNGRILQATDKPSYEELLQMVAELKAQQAAKVSASPVAFARSEKNPKFWTFKHGVKDAWPVSTTPDAWRVILANVKLIESKLPKA